MSINEDTSFIEYSVEQPTQDFVTNFDTIGGTTDVVHVTVDGVLTDTPESSYTVQQINLTTWRITPEVPIGSVVRLYRVTNIDEMMHVFTAGAKFIARNMDNNFKQIRHSQQELHDSTDAFYRDTTKALDEFTQITEDYDAYATATRVIANAAVVTADAAVVTANAATATANGAVITANTANATADAVLDTAQAAVLTANEASAVANGIAGTANAADTKATEALSTANEAKSTADGIAGTADTALERADAALTYITAPPMSQDDADDGTSSTSYIISPVVLKGAIQAGNAGSATKLQTPRKINGVDFDGTEDINISSMPMGVPLFHGGSRATIETGYVAYDGQLLNRADYPAMWAKVQATFPIITDADWLANPSKRGSYSSGNGTTTFRMPDLNGVQAGSLKGLFLRGGGEGEIGGYLKNPGDLLPDAIRNITGGVSTDLNGRSWLPLASSTDGAFYRAGNSTPNTFKPISGYEDVSNYSSLAFDASRQVPTAAENRPVSAVGIWICRVGSTLTEVANPTLHAVLTGGNTFSGTQKMEAVEFNDSTVIRGLVNNLTTGGTAKALTAEQGKVLSASLDILNYCPIAYPNSNPPSGYLAMMGQGISQASYPKLYALYGGSLPDLRGLHIRGLDGGRGMDSDPWRGVLSVQGDAIRNITGSIGNPTDHGAGAFVHAGWTTSGAQGGGSDGVYNFDASRVVPTAGENRVKNIAFLYIVKAG